MATRCPQGRMGCRSPWPVHLQPSPLQDLYSIHTASSAMSSTSRPLKESSSRCPEHIPTSFSCAKPYDPPGTSGPPLPQKSPPLFSDRVGSPDEHPESQAHLQTGIALRSLVTSWSLALCYTHDRLSVIPNRVSVPGVGQNGGEGRAGPVCICRACRSRKP